MKKMLLTAGLAFALTACSGTPLSGPVIYNVNFMPKYDFDTFQYLNGGKDMRLAVVGNPYSVSDKALADAIAKRMSGKNPGSPVTFKTEGDLSEGSSPDTVLVVRFQKDRIATADLCKTGGTPANPSRPGDESARLSFAYCKGGAPLSYGDASLPLSGGPEGVDFKSMFARIPMKLFEVDPSGNRDGCDGGDCT